MKIVNHRHLLDGTIITLTGGGYYLGAFGDWAAVVALFLSSILILGTVGEIRLHRKIRREMEEEGEL